MNAPRLEYHPEARLDLIETFEWYAERNLDAAANFLNELEAAVARVLDAPLRWREAEGGLRAHRLRIYPHSLVYRCTDDQVTIVAVAHGSRLPDYWRNRLGD